jgi:hypothetical protein
MVHTRTRTLALSSGCRSNCTASAHHRQRVNHAPQYHVLRTSLRWLTWLQCRSMHGWLEQTLLTLASMHAAASQSERSTAYFSSNVPMFLGCVLDGVVQRRLEMRLLERRIPQLRERSENHVHRLQMHSSHCKMRLRSQNQANLRQGPPVKNYRHTRCTRNDVPKKHLCSRPSGHPLRKTPSINVHPLLRSRPSL